MNKIKNCIIRLLYWMLNKSKRHAVDWESPKILVVSTTALGDTLWSTPFFTSIKNKYPHATLAVLTSPLGKQILSEHPAIDQLFVLKKPLFFHFFLLLKQLRKQRFQIILVFHASQRVVFPLCYLLKSSRLIGTKQMNKQLDYLFTDLADYKNTHEMHRRDQLCQLIHVSTPKYMPFYKHPSSAANELTEILKRHNIDIHRPYIVIHPGAKDYYKCWPIHSYNQLIALLKKKWASPIIITGTADERALIAPLIQAHPDLISLCGKLSLASLAYLIDKAALLITNDTGPMHLSTAVNSKVIALFGPTDPKQCGPLSHEKDMAYTLAVAKTCRNCIKRRCKEPFCLMQISPSAVMDKIGEVLSL